jgi:phosphate transport system protein
VEQSLKGLSERTLRLLTMAKNTLGRAVWALCEQNSEAARQVLQDEDSINELTDRINQDCLNFIEAFHPSGRELRFATSVMQMIRDLERIGDYGRNIAREAFQLLGCERFGPPAALLAMARLVEQMLDLCAFALNSGQAEPVLKVFPLDDRVDDLQDQASREFLALIAEQPSRLAWLWRLLGVARALERGGDRATNVAEQVYYICSGTRTQGSQWRRPRPVCGRGA